MSSVRSQDGYDDSTAELTMEMSVAPESVSDSDSDSEPIYSDPAVQRAAKIAPVRPSTVGLEPVRKVVSKGTLLCQRYVLEDPIGVGGTSVVFRARDLRREGHGAGETRIALKTPRAELPTYTHAVDRLKNEFRLAQALTHPHVVRVFDLDEEEGCWFMTMELLEGKTLAAAMAQSPFASGQPSFTPRRAAEILRAAGEALAFAHDHGVVHGDFKPGNIFLPSTGPVRVLDFGSATSTEPSLEHHSPAATACYASPQVLNLLRPDRRDDVFSFACVAHEILGGVHPFERRSSLEASKATWKPLRSWNLNDRQWYALSEALTFNRDARPGNVRALLAVLFPASSSDRIEIPERVDIEAATQNSEPLTPVVIPPIDLPRDAFGKSSGSNAFITTAAVLTLALAAIAVYFQLNRHPEWPQQLRDGSAQVLEDMKKTVLGSSSASSPQQSQEPVSAVTQATAPTPPAATTPLTPQAPELAPALAEASKARPPAAPHRARNDVMPITSPDIFVSFAEDSITVNEGANNAVLTLKRDGNLESRTEVYWRAVPKTAQSGEDFILGASGIAVFADGQSTRSIYIPLLHDAIKEPAEEFFVELHDAAAGTQIWPTARAQVIIRDDN